VYFEEVKAEDLGVKADDLEEMVVAVVDEEVVEEMKQVVPMLALLVA